MTAIELPVGVTFLSRNDIFGMLSQQKYGYLEMLKRIQNGEILILDLLYMPILPILPIVPRLLPDEVDRDPIDVYCKWWASGKLATDHFHLNRGFTPETLLNFYIMSRLWTMMKTDIQKKKYPMELIPRTAFLEACLSLPSIGATDEDWVKMYNPHDTTYDISPPDEQTDEAATRVRKLYLRNMAREWLGIKNP